MLEPHVFTFTRLLRLAVHIDSTRSRLGKTHEYHARSKSSPSRVAPPDALCCPSPLPYWNLAQELGLCVGCGARLSRRVHYFAFLICISTEYCRSEVMNRCINKGRW